MFCGDHIRGEVVARLTLGADCDIEVALAGGEADVCREEDYQEWPDPED